MTKKETDKEILAWNYNQGRLEGDRKWIKAVEDRIAELEKKVGIPELRRLLKETRYRWRNDKESPP